MTCRHKWLDTYSDRYHRIDICAKCGIERDAGIDFEFRSISNDYKPEPTLEESLDKQAYDRWKLERDGI